MGYVAIHIPEFPTLAWLRWDTDARPRPAAVIEGKPPLERVVSFNRAAKELGLIRGMSRIQAETSGQVLFHPRSISEEREALNLVFQVVERFSPRVQIIASPVNAYAGGQHLAAMLLADQSGTELLFGNPSAYARRIQESLLEIEFHANVNVAPNAEASLLLARSYAGAMHVCDRDLEQKLATLPLSSLRVENTTLRTLERWGIRNLGELAALPEAALISRIGQQAKRLQRLARGSEDHLLVPEVADLELIERSELDVPLESLESLLFILSPMLETLLLQAINHAYAIRSVRVTLELEKAAPHKLEVRPAIPVQNRDLLLKLINLKLQNEPPKAAILAVTLTAEPAVPQVAQRGLFQSQFPEPDKLDLLIARLKAIVGEENVGSPRLTNSHASDNFLMHRFEPCAGSEASQQRITACRSALRRFRPTLPVKVIAQNERPTLLFWKGERRPLGQTSGPWQTSGCWWDGRRWDADEWDVIASDPHEALRLRYESLTGIWYVAGQYD